MEVSLETTTVNFFEPQIFHQCVKTIMFKTGRSEVKKVEETMLEFFFRNLV